MNKGEICLAGEPGNLIIRIIEKNDFNQSFHFFIFESAGFNTFVFHFSTMVVVKI